MKIKNLYFKDKKNGIELKEITFDDKLNLLVGVSGAGKTTILKIINLIKSEITANKTTNTENINTNNVIWNITLETNKNVKCNWVFEKENEKIINEKIYLNDDLILRRNSTETFLKETKLPKLSSNESVLKILEEDFIIDIIESMKIINIFDEKELNMVIGDGGTFYKKYTDFGMLLKDDIDIFLKLYISHIVFPNVFSNIKESFKEIFPNVEDIRYFRTIYSTYRLEIKEKNDENWILIDNISSGMLKTLNFLAQIKLSNNESVLLIDEFENSLGVNCIDIVSDSLLNSNSNMQYIITSHHPYIINKIDMKYWKIVTRKGNVIQTKNISELNLPKSKHEAFKQLLNLKEFTEGISI